MSTPESILTAIRARGGNPLNLRDGVHEACHAIELGLEEWDRESIHWGMMELRVGEQIAAECRARAVEQIVCARFNVPIESVDHWAFWTSMEALRNRIDVPIDVIVAGVKARMNDPRTLELVDAVIALGESA